MSLILSHHFLLHLFQVTSVCTVMSECPRRFQMSIPVTPKAFNSSTFSDFAGFETVFHHALPMLVCLLDFMTLHFLWSFFLVSLSSSFLFLSCSRSPLSLALSLASPPLPSPEEHVVLQFKLQPSFLHIFTMLFRASFPLS